MPTTLTRLYASEGQASNAIEKLKEAGYASVQVIKHGDTGGAADLQSAIRQAGVYTNAAQIYAEKMGPGMAMVIAQADFGSSDYARVLLESEDPVDAGVRYEATYSGVQRENPNIIRTSGKRSIIARRAKPRTKPRRKRGTFLGIKTLIRPKARARRPSNKPITGGTLIRKKG